VEKANFPVTLMCRVLGLSTSGYYAWRRRKPSPRAQQNQVLVAEIEKVHKASRA
jgi:uncharacterized iron-regulated membrane protein